MLKTKRNGSATDWRVFAMNFWLKLLIRHFVFLVEVRAHRLQPLFSYFHLHPNLPRSVKLNIYSPLMFSQGESRKINRIEFSLGGSSNLKPVWRGMRFETRNVAAAGRRVITFLITSCMFLHFYVFRNEMGGNLSVDVIERRLMIHDWRHTRRRRNFAVF